MKLLKTEEVNVTNAKDGAACEAEESNKSENVKLKAYLGFALRSGKITLGTDNIENEKKSVYLILADRDLGNTARKRLKTTADVLGVPLYVTSGKLGDLLSRPAVKAAALKDKNLAKAAEGAVQADKKWNLYSEGEI